MNPFCQVSCWSIGSYTFYLQRSRPFFYLLDSSKRIFELSFKKFAPIAREYHTKNLSFCCLITEFMVWTWQGNATRMEILATLVGGYDEETDFLYGPLVLFRAFFSWAAFLKKTDSMLLSTSCSTDWSIVLVLFSPLSYPADMIVVFCDVSRISARWISNLYFVSNIFLHDWHWYILSPWRTICASKVA